MRRLLPKALLAGVVAGLVGCADAPATSAPTAALQPAPERAYADVWKTAESYGGHGSPTSGNGGLVRCERHPTYVGRAMIGANGGVIRVGRSRVIVPPGALNKQVLITATMPEGEHVTIQFEFQPHGLVFKKPAGLILDAEGCDIASWYAPSIVYLSDAGEILEHIDSFYSNYWHLIAAPIWHFSRYAIAW